MGNMDMVIGHAVVRGQRVMFATIVSVAIRVGIVLQVPIGGHIFLIFSPAYAGLFKEVDNTCDVRRNSHEVIRGQTKKSPPAAAIWFC